MKKLIIGLLLCSVFSVVSCMFDVKSGLVGTWKYQAGTTTAELIFKSDDTYTEEIVTSSGRTEGKGKYTIDKDIITLSPEGGTDVKRTFAVNGDTLFLSALIYIREK